MISSYNTNTVDKPTVSCVAINNVLVVHDFSTHSLLWSGNRKEKYRFEDVVVGRS